MAPFFPDKNFKNSLGFRVFFCDSGPLKKIHDGGLLSNLDFECGVCCTQVVQTLRIFLRLLYPGTAVQTLRFLIVASASLHLSLGLARPYPGTAVQVQVTNAIF